MLILISVLIVVDQLNPKLSSDYFSIIKMFFMREGEDSQIHSRITSSINILFYVYCSLMIGYYLMIIFRFHSRSLCCRLSLSNRFIWRVLCFYG